jgi:F0F1-type ATP synthase membrane subunit b/b'
MLELAALDERLAEIERRLDAIDKRHQETDAAWAKSSVEIVAQMRRLVGAEPNRG